MTCPKCKSENVNVQIINETELKTKHRGILYWLFIGWWWIPIKWCFFTFFALLAAFLKRKDKKIVNKQKTMCACQNCGYTWSI